MVGPASATAVAGAVALALTAAALTAGSAILVAAGVVATCCVVGFRFPNRRGRQVVSA